MPTWATQDMPPASAVLVSQAPPIPATLPSSQNELQNRRPGSANVPISISPDSTPTTPVLAAVPRLSTNMDAVSLALSDPIKSSTPPTIQQIAQSATPPATPPASTAAPQRSLQNSVHPTAPTPPTSTVRNASATTQAAAQNTAQLSQRLTIPLASTTTPLLPTQSYQSGSSTRSPSSLLPGYITSAAARNPTTGSVGAIAQSSIPSKNAKEILTQLLVGDDDLEAQQAIPDAGQRASKRTGAATAVNGAVSLTPQITVSSAPPRLMVAPSLGRMGPTSASQSNPPHNQQITSTENLSTPLITLLSSSNQPLLSSPNVPLTTPTPNLPLTLPDGFLNLPRTCLTFLSKYMEPAEIAYLSIPENAYTLDGHRILGKHLPNCVNMWKTMAQQGTDAEKVGRLTADWHKAQAVTNGYLSAASGASSTSVGPPVGNSSRPSEQLTRTSNDAATALIDVSPTTNSHGIDNTIPPHMTPVWPKQSNATPFPQTLRSPPLAGPSNPYAAPPQHPNTVSTPHPISLPPQAMSSTFAASQQWAAGLESVGAHTRLAWDKMISSKAQYETAVQADIQRMVAEFTAKNAETRHRMQLQANSLAQQNTALSTQNGAINAYMAAEAISKRTIEALRADLARINKASSDHASKLQESAIKERTAHATEETRLAAEMKNLRDTTHVNSARWSEHWKMHYKNLANQPDSEVTKLQEQLRARNIKMGEIQKEKEDAIVLINYEKDKLVRDLELKEARMAKSERLHQEKMKVKDGEYEKSTKSLQAERDGLVVDFGVLVDSNIRLREAVGLPVVENIESTRPQGSMLRGSFGAIADLVAGRLRRDEVALAEKGTECQRLTSELEEGKKEQEAVIGALNDGWKSHEEELKRVFHAQYEEAKKGREEAEQKLKDVESGIFVVEAERVKVKALKEEIQEFKAARSAESDKLQMAVAQLDTLQAVSDGVPPFSAVPDPSQASQPAHPSSQAGLSSQTLAQSDSNSRSSKKRKQQPLFMSEEDDEEEEKKPKIEPDQDGERVAVESAHKAREPETGQASGSTSNKRQRADPSSAPSTSTSSRRTTQNAPLANVARVRAAGRVNGSPQPTVAPPSASTPTLDASASQAAVTTSSRSSTPVNDLAPIDEAWVQRNVDLSILNKNGGQICKLCYVEQKKVTPNIGEIADQAPLPSWYKMKEVKRHLMDNHPTTLGKLRAKRMKDGKDK